MATHSSQSLNFCTKAPEFKSGFGFSIWHINFFKTIL